MAFVNELVPEEQKSKFDPKAFFHPLGGYPIVTYRWVIDHERGAFLIRLGGGGPWEGGDAPKPREYLALSWKGNIVKSEALYSETGRFLDGNLVGCWDVVEVNIPPALEARKDVVLELIREGLEAMEDSAGNRERLTKVNVHFQHQVQQ